MPANKALHTTASYVALFERGKNSCKVVTRLTWCRRRVSYNVSRHLAPCRTRCSRVPHAHRQAMIGPARLRVLPWRGVTHVTGAGSALTSPMRAGGSMLVARCSPACAVPPHHPNSPHPCCTTSPGGEQVAGADRYRVSERRRFSCVSSMIACAIVVGGSSPQALGVFSQYLWSAYHSEFWWRLSMQSVHINQWRQHMRKLANVLCIPRSLLAPSGLLFGATISLFLQLLWPSFHVQEALQLYGSFFGFSIVWLGLWWVRRVPHRPAKVVAIMLLVLGLALLCYGLFDIARSIYAMD